MDLQKNSTKGSAAALAALALAIAVLLVYGAYYFNQHPDLIEGIMGTVATIVMILFAVALVAIFIYMIAGIFYYASKGEIVQTNGDYNLNDVKSVKEMSSDNYEENKK